LGILDHHTRRQEADGRVIGTLLGRRDGNKVELTNCFAVPHAERGDEVAIGKDFNKQMLSLYLRANRKEQVVGWYASCAPDSGEIADTSSLIHEFYAGEVEEGSDPIHLVVDTRLFTDALYVKAFKSTPVQVQGEPLANLFHEVSLSMESSEQEKIALDKMVTANETTPEQAATSLQVSMERLLELLERASEYVDGVVEGKTAPDAAVGRQLADTLAAVPRIRPAVFDRLFQDSLQDLLMVTYLSNITKTQLTIAEKLNASMGNF
jgi:translation initiation factor 3 subunit F